LAAQSGGYSNLEFIENKGQWDSSIRFNAGIATGNLFMQRKGFTVLLHDTNDMKRIGLLLHGEQVAGGSGGSGGKAAAVQAKKAVASTACRSMISRWSYLHYRINRRRFPPVVREKNNL